MGFPASILSGIRSFSISGKPSAPDTPPDSHPPTPKFTKTYSFKDAAPPPSGTVATAPAQTNSSKRWTRNFTSFKPIPRANKLPISMPTISIPRHIANAPPVSKDLVKVFQFIEERFSEHFKNVNFEPAVKQLKEKRDIKTLRDTYQWQQPGSTNPSYPPCLKSIPVDEQTGLLEIFDLQRLIDTSIALLPFEPPLIGYRAFGAWRAGTMAGLEARMAKLRKQHKNIGTEPSIANRPDWYSDAVFGQQSFTGPNPTSISNASATWIEEFAGAAKKQGNENMFALISTSDPESFFIQDYSYFRDAAGAFPGATLKSDDGKRFGTAAVTLLQLSRTGNLHPLAICIDYTVSLEQSVVIFNSRLRPTDPTKGEKDDWSWRYAKMCHMVSDYYRHELESHLNNCHFVEEATIVAAQRSFTSQHIVYKLLEPHWLKTLSLNASARSILVPKVIVPIVGMSSSVTYAFILDSYKHFNWTQSYIPNDLSSRGFAPSSLDDPKFHNYAWARNMVPMWLVLQKFVSSVLTCYYASDAEVAEDKAIQSWCDEMHSPTGAQMASFPDIKTIEELTSAIVMCIHIASPQHNSINYLQCYYMSFVAAKPPCLMAPLPSSLPELMAYKEKDIMKALPIHDEHVWLLAEQLPYLSSYGVSEDQTLVAYAQGLEDEARDVGDKGLEKAAAGLYDDLMKLGEVFDKNSLEMDDRVVAYNVMDPTELAVSILI